MIGTLSFTSHLSLSRAWYSRTVFSADDGGMETETPGYFDFSLECDAILTKTGGLKPSAPFDLGNDSNVNGEVSNAG